MAVTFELLRGERILIRTLSANSDFAADSVENMIQTVKRLDELKKSVILIFDMSMANRSLDDLIAEVNMIKRQNGLLRHPRVIESAVVTRLGMMKRVANSTASSLSDSVEFFFTREAAVNYARRSLAMRGTG